MNDNVKTIAGIGALVVVAAAISAGVFVTTGSQLAVWFAVFGIPLVIVGGIATYVRGTISSRGTSEAQFVTQQARIAAESFADSIRTRNELTTHHPEWEPGLEARIESLAGEFRTQGVDFESTTGSFDLASVGSDGSLQQIEQLKEEVDAFDAELDDQFLTFAESKRDDLDSCVTRIEAVGLVSAVDRPPEPTPGSSPIDRHDNLETWYSTTADSVDGAIQAVREIQRESDSDADGTSVEEQLETARAALDDRDIEVATDQVLEARTALEESLSGSFSDERTAVGNLLETVESVPVERHVDAAVMDDVRSIEAEHAELGSGLELTKASHLGSQLRDRCIEIVETMERDLESAHERLQAADLPDGYYTKAAAIEESHGDELRESEELSAFTSRWHAAAEALSPALETAETKVAVVDAYDDVAELIEDELRQTATVTEDELPVRDGEEFLGLYARRNDQVTFDPSGPALRAEATETYALDVQVTYERGGPVRTATVAISAPGYAAESSAETRVAGTVSFDDVPAGTISVSADPGDDEFGPIERSISVDDDQEIELTFEERGLRERVCENVDIDVASVLDDVEPDLTAAYSADGYVTSAQSLPVKSDYADCLLVTWAERAGHDVTIDGDDVLVYDRDAVRRELRNVATYNIEAGETLAFKELEENFLSVPAPPSVVSDVVSALELDCEYSVTMDDGTLKTE